MKTDILVIGGGIVGTSVARELQAAGRNVVLIDKARIGEGCSQANAGWVTPCFAMPLPQPGMLLKSIRWLLDSASPLHIQPSLSPTLARWLWRFLLAMNRQQMLRSIEVLTDLSKSSLDSYAELASRQSAEAQARLGFERKGLLMVGATPQGVKAAREEMNLMAGRGIAGRSMSRDEVLHFEPALRPSIQGGVFFPDEAQVEPHQMTLAMADDFRRLGGQVIEHAEAYDFEMSNGKITEVITTQGRFSPDLVVLATGSWSPEVARKLRLQVPILGGKGYSMTLEGVATKPVKPIMIVERKIAVTPFQDKLRIAGTLELVDQDFGISVSRLNAIVRGAHEFLNLQSDGKLSEVRDIWRGLRPCTPDGVPLIGMSRKHSNLFYCAGHQMLGLQSAPGSARLASELIRGLTPFTDPKPFEPARFE